MFFSSVFIFSSLHSLCHSSRWEVVRRTNSWQLSNAMLKTYGIFSLLNFDPTFVIKDDAKLCV